MKAEKIALVGGGNMASAMLGGLLRAGMSTAQFIVVEPYEPQREKLAAQFGVQALAVGDASLADASTVVWAVKPQLFTAAAEPLKAWLGQALQLSVMAGITTASIAAASGSERVVRAMPNTPALIGQGIAGLFARPAVSADERATVERLLAPTGQTLWVDREDDLDAVTALSGSGPAYFFFVVEAMMAAAQDMGLTGEQGRRLALATCAGTAALGLASSESPTVLRERVTSKGGTTYAAVTSMQADGVDAALRRAVLAAQKRAAELGKEFG
ncbi:pyrroline-5-carboxylate reductase [Roseateles asaccharophilus]|uniref:Pyrroline-5-carboxylate reductase n=1 Tax=Roseateles asaccharophilus TaxID=582607 RepID=A0ABU2AEQ3_9BURK|nr:pyrroline-5-carboxylate reductase [Roseateles asaccharophilus]MDR7335666.1 pyrroline-5-carboxylate reductase [Roseateles asaccharophilus]